MRAVCLRTPTAPSWSLQLIWLHLPNITAFVFEYSSFGSASPATQATQASKSINRRGKRERRGGEERMGGEEGRDRGRGRGEEGGEEGRRGRGGKGEEKKREKYAKDRRQRQMWRRDRLL